MVGSAVVALPWAFEQSGILLSLALLVIACLISCYTCMIIVNLCGDKDDFFDVLFKYWGKRGWLVGLLSTIAIVLGACIVYFVIMVQLFYPIIMSVKYWISPGQTELVLDMGMAFDKFSVSYVAILIFFIEIYVTNKKDLHIFINLISYSAVFIIALILFVVLIGLVSLGNTSYSFALMPSSKQDSPILFMAPNFSALAGMLCVGFYLHTNSVPII